MEDSKRDCEVHNIQQGMEYTLQHHQILHSPQSLQFSERSHWAIVSTRLSCLDARSQQKKLKSYSNENFVRITWFVLFVNPKECVLACREWKDFSNCAITIRAHVKSGKPSTIPEWEIASSITLESEFECDFSCLLQLNNFSATKTIWSVKIKERENWMISESLCMCTVTLMERVTSTGVPCPIPESI